MEDNKKYWLNEFGRREWIHKTENISLQRPYYWNDRMIMIDESEGRRVINGGFDFSGLEENLIPDLVFSRMFDIKDFIPIDKNYYRREKLKRILNDKNSYQKN